MPAATCSTLYYTIFALFAVAFLLLLLKQNRGAAAALAAGALISGAGVVSIVVTARRLPLSGAYESIVYILFVLSTLALLSNRSATESILKYRTGVLTGSVMLVLLTLHIRSPKELNHDFFMYESLWVNLFFNLRLLAAAFFVHAAVLFNVAAWTRPVDHPAGSAISRGPTPGLAMVTGHKQENVRLAPGETHVFGENCRIDLLDVTFSDNPDFLTMNKKKRHQMMTRENFHPKLNFAKIALSQNGRPVGLQNVFFLTPLKHRSLRVTVADFIVKEINGQKTVGVNLIITRNFFTGFFFTAYALMIIALACFVAITWKPRTQDI